MHFVAVSPKDSGKLDISKRLKYNKKYTVLMSVERYTELSARNIQGNTLGIKTQKAGLLQILRLQI